jgi:multidrug resistance efflux pump
MKTFAIALVCLIVGAAIGGFIMWNNQPAKPGLPLAGSLSSGDLDIVCSGRVAADGPEIPLLPNVAGQVKAIKVKDGEKVKGGETVILELDDKQYRIKVEGYQAAVMGATKVVQEAESEKAKYPKLKELQEYAINAAVLATESARKELQNLREQADKNPTLITQTMIDQADLGVKRLQEAEKAEQKRLAILEQTDVQLKVDQAVANLGTVTAELKAAEEALRNCIVVAPADGVILRVLAGKGSQVAPGSPMPVAIFAPGGPVVVRAELDQEHLGKVTPGMKVTFKDSSYADSPTWEGTVSFVSQYVARPTSFLLEPGEVNDVRTVGFTVIPTPSADKGALLIGQRVRVRIENRN